MANEPQVAVRFAVKDAEVVRQALANLGKDGEAALKRLDAAGRPVPKGMTAISDTLGELRGRAAGLASSTGLAGTALLGLGPAGLAAAAALGAVYLAFTKISEGNKAFGQYAREVRDFSNATGFTRTEVQALTDILAQNGIEEEKSRTGLEKMSVARAEAAKGAGELYVELKRLNPAFAEQFAASRSAADALAVLTKAMIGLDGPTQALLAKLAFGRGGVAFAQGLLDIAGKGGLGAVEAAAIKAGSAIDGSIIDKQAKAATVAEQTAKVVDRKWNEAYASIYLIWKDFKKNVLGVDESGTFWITIATTIKSNADFARKGLFGPADPLEQALAERAKIEAALAASRPDGKPSFGQLAIDTFTLKPLRTPKEFKVDPDELQRMLTDKDREIQRIYDQRRAGGITAERSVPVVEKSPESERLRQIDASTRALEAEKERMAILGAAATPTEQLKLKTDELNLAVMKNAALSDAAGRALAEETSKKNAAAVAARERLGLAREEEIRTVALAQVDRDYSNGYIKNAAERAMADKIATKEAKDRADAVAVKASDFPQLTRLGQEAGDLRKQLDTELSGALRGVTSDILAMAKGTETASQGFTNMTMKMVDAIAQAVLMKTVIGPISGSLSSGLSSLFGGGAGGSSGAIANTANSSGFSIAGAAKGAVFGHGVSGFSNSIVDRPTLFRFARGAGLMGEAGPEAIIPLRRDSSGRLGIAGGGGGPVNISVHNNLGVAAHARAEHQPDGSIDLILNAVEARGADRVSRGQGPMAKLMPRAPLIG